jgi:hypothetical protein
MKRAFLLLIVIAGLGALPSASAAAPVTKADSAIDTVGVYDSRAVAVAFAGTVRFRASLDELRKKHQAAKESGDEEQVAVLEAEGQARQHELHRQGFGTAPVDNILAHYLEDLAKLKAEQGLERLISKWDQASLARYPDAEQIDITMIIVDLLHPNETQREFALQIQDKEPVPLDQLK